MKSINFIGLALSLGLLFTLSCKKNTALADQNTSVKTFSEYLGKPIVVDLKGKVLDTDQNPVENVKVIVGNDSIFTDNNGLFILKNASAHENLLTVDVTKAGYKNEQICIAPEGGTASINITFYKESDLSIFRFNKNNHNLPQTSVK
ncbi:MAG: hypothetical protein AAFX55_02400 [Bacteroidota bacterium]